MYLIASELDYTIFNNNQEEYMFSYYDDDKLIQFCIIKKDSNWVNYKFYIKNKDELEQLKKLISLPELKKRIDEDYKYQINLDKAKKRYLEDLTKILARKNISNKQKFLIQAAAITAQSYPYKVENNKLQHGFHLDNDIISFRYTQSNKSAKMLLFKDGDIINLTPTLFVYYIQNHILNSKKQKLRPKNFNWWYKIYSGSNERKLKEYNQGMKVLSKTETKPLKSRLNNKAKKLAEAREELIKSRSALPRDFRLDDPPSKRGRPRKNPDNSQHNQQQDIEIENEK